MNKAFKTFAAVVVIILLLLGGITLLKKRKAQLAELPSPEEPAYVVEGFRVKEGVVRVSRNFIGKLVANKQVRVATKFPGYIKEIYVSEGDRIKKGQPLVLIDDLPIRKEIQNLRLTLQALESQLEALKVQKEALATALRTYERIYSRNKRLYEKKAIPKEKLELSYTKYKEVQAQYMQTVAKIEELKAKIKQVHNTISVKENSLSYLKIRSPIDGIVERVFLKEGNLAPAGKPIMSLHTTDRYRIILSVPQSLPVRRGTKALVKFEDGSLLVEVSKVYPSSDRNGLKVLEIGIKRVPENVKVGSLLDLSLILEEREGLAVPNRAILHTDNGSFVLILKEGRFQKVPVRILASDENFSLIEGDLGEGTVVAVAQEGKLQILSLGKRGRFVEGDN